MSAPRLRSVGPMRDLYYALKPILPRPLQIWLRRRRSVALLAQHGARWPIWEEAAAPPPSWPGWPGGRRFALVLTHDVEGPRGVAHAERLAELERARGMRSAFAFVPERYTTPPELRERLRAQGGEIMVHGLRHDGKLFRDRATFVRRAARINAVLRAWDTRGFAAPAAHHHLEWMSELDIDYDVSTYHFDPFEPQPCGLARIFPFWVGAPGSRRGFVELPYTLPQDFTLFVLLRERTSVRWRQGLDWIAASGGMALVKAHPDYMAFRGSEAGHELYPVERYLELLDHVRDAYGDTCWVAQPSEVAAYWLSLHATGVAASASAIEARETFCPVCRTSHARGWMRNYPDRREETRASERTDAPHVRPMPTASGGSGDMTTVATVAPARRADDREFRGSTNGLGRDVP
jgi:hypothetical protein